jgi:hypothetical protein
MRRISLIDDEASCDDGSDDEDENGDEDPTLGGFIVLTEDEDGDEGEEEVSTRSGRVSRPNKRSYGEIQGQRYL